MSATDLEPSEGENVSAVRLGPIDGLLCLALSICFFGGLVYLITAGTGRGPAQLLVPLTGLALLAVLLLRRFRSRHGLWLAGCFMVFVLLLAFLATDEPPIHRPIALEKLTPSFPGAALSQEVLLRFTGVDAKTLGIDNRHMLTGQGPNMSNDPEDPVKFRNFLVGQSTAIEADWDDMMVVRTWWAELATYDRLGDTSLGKPDDRLPPFQPIRAYLQTAIAIAGLQALEGNGDAAFATLQPALEVARKLEPSSRTLVRSMVARVGQRMTIVAANFVLDTTEVSPEAKARFAAALANGSSGAEGARQMIAVETARTAYILEDPATHAPGLFSPAGSWQSSVTNLVAPVLYNPQRTVNAFLEWSARMQDLAARREGTKMDAMTQDFVQKSAALGIRNVGGSYILQQAIPALGKVVDSYWITEDKREALLKRLKAPAPVSQPSTPTPSAP